MTGYFLELLAHCLLVVSLIASLISYLVPCLATSQVDVYLVPWLAI